MKWSEVEPRLLPRSGVGVAAPWLVIAVPGNPIVRIDLRMVDRVDRIVDEDQFHSMLLCVGELDVAVFIADGPEAVDRLVSEAAPLTRSGGGCLPPLDVAPSIAPSYAKLHLAPPPRHDVFELSRQRTRIGRSEVNDLVLRHPSVSQVHAEITRNELSGRHAIADRDASNGVRVNGTAHTTCALEDGDVIDLGHVRMRFAYRGDVELEDPGPPSRDRMVIVDSAPVLHRDEQIHLGALKYRLSDVRDYAAEGANLPLPEGRLLQAALTLLVVEAT